MEIKIRTAILSHLSDAQELMDMGFKDKAYDRITFAKKLVIEYPNTDKYVSEEELNNLWCSFLFEPKK